MPCTVTYMSMAGEFHLGLGAGATPKPVTAHLLADFKDAPAAGAYGFDSLVNVNGSASAESKKGVVWEMAKGGPSKLPGAPATKRKGEVALTLTAVGKHPGDFHGHATLTLVPTNFVGKPETAPVTVELPLLMAKRRALLVLAGVALASSPAGAAATARWSLASSTGRVLSLDVTPHARPATAACCTSPPTSGPQRLGQRRAVPGRRSCPRARRCCR